MPVVQCVCLCALWQALHKRWMPRPAGLEHCPKSFWDIRNMKCLGKRDTIWNIPRSIMFSPLHFMLYRGKWNTFGTVYSQGLTYVSVGLYWLHPTCTQAASLSKPLGPGGGKLHPKEVHIWVAQTVWILVALYWSWTELLWETYWSPVGDLLEYSLTPTGVLLESCLGLISD